MIIRAELKCKQAGCEADPCAVDKVIELPNPRFKQFSRALLADYDFIAENKNAVRHDDDARHCLLVLDAEGKDGFLVDPQGYNYARYSAFVPNARSLLTPDMGIDRKIKIADNGWEMYNKSDLRVASGNYLRLKNLYVRYNFSDRICHKIRAQMISVRFEATNLWLLADKKLKGQDPEQVTLGGVSTPPTSSYTLGLDITF